MTRLELLPNLIWSIFAISLAENPVDYVKDILVESNSGPVNGFVAQLSSEFAVDVFLKIPFAKPPIDDLRFEKPEPVEPWITPLEAKSFSKSCWPHDLSGLPENSFSDDCLYLNIIRPHDQSSRPESGWPVLVWIHGGGYSVGFSWYYGYQNISLNFVSQNLIVVTIQYRLAFSGFTSTGDEEMPGNLGYWDQTQAFKFLKENIAEFGGNPNNLVAFGLSAGGASTAALSISPASRDLISKSIEMSGAVFANWHASDQIIQVTEDLSKVLGCPPVTKSKNLKKCFKTKTAQEFLTAVKIIGGTRKDVNLLKFHPRIDGDFFPVDFPQLIKESPPKPTMMGYTDQEAGYFTILGLSKSINAFYIPKESFQFYSLKNFTDFVEKIIVPKKIFKSDAKKIQKEIIDFYVKNTDYKSLLKSYSDLMSDIWFNIPALWTARAKTEAEWPVYLYFNDYYNDEMFSDDIPVKGSMHANEYPYMFGKFALTPFVFDKNDWKIQRIIVDTIVEFTKTGNPSTKSFKWPSTNATNPFIHAFIRPNPVVGNQLQKEALKLWDRISKNYDFDIIRGIQKTTGRHKDEL